MEDFQVDEVEEAGRPMRRDSIDRPFVSTGVHESDRLEGLDSNTSEAIMCFDGRGTKRVLGIIRHVIRGPKGKQATGDTAASEN